jgi:ribonuclease-3
MKKIDYELLEKKIGYRFKNKSLMKTALTHKTFAFEANTPLEFNERLEFFGDSILGFVVAEQLYKGNKYFSEGELTRRRSFGVNNNFLAEVAKKLDIGQFLLLGKGEIKQNGSQNPTNLANALEALIGAIYLDSDMNCVRRFILDKIFTKEFQF